MAKKSQCQVRVTCIREILRTLAQQALDEIRERGKSMPDIDSDEFVMIYLNDLTPYIHCHQPSSLKGCNTPLL